MKPYKWQIAKIYALITISLLVLALGFFVFGFIPMSQYLRDAHAQEMHYFLEGHSRQLDGVVGKHIELAKQAASRTVIRHALIDYNEGKVPLEQFVSITSPKLSDAMKSSEDILGITRFDKLGKRAIEIGKTIEPRHYLESAASLKGIVMRGPTDIPNDRVLLYYSPIREEPHGIVGYDILAMSDREVQRIIQSPFSQQGNLFLVQGAEILYAPKEIIDEGLSTVVADYSKTRALNDRGYLIEKRPVANTEWTLYLAVNKDRFFSKVNWDVLKLVLIISVIMGGVIAASIVSLRPIISSLLENEMLLVLACTDSLTKLYNHRHFQELLSKELSRASRYARPLALIMLDIDNFKAINDQYGHPQGDVVLELVGRLIKSSMRESDIAARYGGEEFSIILSETDLSGAKVLAERLRKKIREMDIVLGRTTLRVTASFGVTSYDPGKGQKEKAQLIEAADRALYQSKNAGKNRVSTVEC